MRRLIPLLGAALMIALALSSAAGADTFRVVRPHASSGPGSVAFSARSGGTIAFTGTPNGAMSFAALRPIWQAAGNASGIPWEVLAAINKVETDFGRNLGPSSAGAIGWMQFMPSTWARWGVDANGDGVADPNNPTDAIFSAARYLVGCGGQFDIARAVYCYNHTSWYVTDVLGLAAQYSLDGGGGLFSVGPSQAQLAAESTNVGKTKKRLIAAVARARTLAHAERRFLRVAEKSPLLSDQLEAHKRAVLLGVRRSAVETRAARLRAQLRTATERLSSANDQVTSLSFPSAIGGLQVDRIDEGVDYTSSGPYTAVAAGTVVYIDPNFWQGTPAVYEKLDRPVVVDGHRYDEIYYSETAALVRVGERLVPGQPVIGPGSAELGFAKGTLPAAHGVYHEGDQTTAGQDFYRYMAAGHPGSGSSPARFYLLGGSIDTFQPSGGADAFTSDVVYFTH